MPIIFDVTWQPTIPRTLVNGFAYRLCHRILYYIHAGSLHIWRSHGNGSSDQEAILPPIRRGTGSNDWPVLDWAWEIMVQDRFIINIIHMKNFFHQIWKTISVAQSVCKAIQQGPGTGWLPSDIKNYWHRNFWKKLEGLQACPTWSEVTSAEWLIREAGYTLWNDEDENKSIMGTRCVYNWTNMMVGMGLDKI